ncbi:MAG: flagellar hook-associated protein FlgK [Janthinobacterium lividum]
MNTSIGSILSNATSGLRASQAGIAVVSDNIANAGVAGYTRKQQDVASFLVGNDSNGVRTGLVSRSVDSALQASVWSQGSRVAALTVRSQVLTSVNAVQGMPGDGTSLADAVTGLQNGFTQLQSDPSSAAQQASVVAAAGTLAVAINSAARAVNTQRNSVQSQIGDAVTSLNAALATVRDTTHDIIAAQGAGTDTATLQDRRDQALQTISGLLDVSYDVHANGDLGIIGKNGFSIPLDSTFSTASATLSPASSAASGSIPPILLHSSNPAEPATDVTARLSGGALGELVTLRDTVLPGYTSSLDAFAAKLSDRFASQGLQLFTDGTQAGGSTAYAGLSSAITVNPDVAANPALVRDGTPGTPFAVNPANGPAGYSGLIDRVLGQSFAAGGGSLAADAGAFVARQSRDTAQTSADLTTTTAYQTTLSARFGAQSGVNVDEEMGLMIKLQNSYQANARVIQTTQSMFTALMNATIAA